MVYPKAVRNRAKKPAVSHSLRPAVPVLVITSIAAFMAFLDATIVNIAFPSIEKSFVGEPLSTLSWVLNGYNVVMAAFLVVGGRLADIAGRRRLFGLGISLFTLFSAGCALAPNALWLIAMRVGQAGGAALLVPASMALLLSAAPVQRRATAVAIYAATAAFAAGIGPSLGGVLIELSNWRMVFLVNIPVGLLALLATYRHIPESREKSPGVPDLAGGAVLASGIGSLALALVKAPEWGWWSVETVTCFAVAAVALPTVVMRSRHHTSPVIDLQLMRVRSFAVANLATLFFATAFFCASLSGVLFLTMVWHYSALTAGLAVSPSPLISAVVAGPAGRIADRFGQRVVIVPGALLFATGVSYLAVRIGDTPGYLGIYLPAALVFGSGVGLAFPALTSAALNGVSEQRFASASAMNSVARQLGGVLGVSILIAVFGSPAPQQVVEAFQHIWYVAAAIGFVSAVPLLASRRQGGAQYGQR